MAVGRFLVAVAFCPLVLAFLNTVPFVAWSSHKSQTIDQLSTKTRHLDSLLQSILSIEDLCDFDAVVFVQQERLHASDLRILSPSSKFAQILSNASSSYQAPYTTPQTSTSLSDTAELVSSNCRTQLVSFTSNIVPGHFSHDSKNVLSINMPSLNGFSGGTRIEKVSSYVSQLADQLLYISETFPNHLVIYAGSAPVTFFLQHLARQQPDTDEGLTRPVFDSVHAPVNTTLAEGGILKRYQLLTPGLITVLLVAFFILVPIVLFGFSALASIQSPLRVEGSKGYNAAEKKAQ